MLEEVDKIKEAIFKFFENHFKKVGVVRHILKADDIPELNNEESEDFEKVFTADEIREPVFDCDNSKCPGLDGFNLDFLKNC
ncbi:unnamed protein product [Lathyrus sativus]|nr:unnamed protein product [Lathyrus sativus]